MHPMGDNARESAVTVREINNSRCLSLKGENAKGETGSGDERDSSGFGSES